MAYLIKKIDIYGSKVVEIAPRDLSLDEVKNHVSLKNIKNVKDKINSLKNLLECLKLFKGAASTFEDYGDITDVLGLGKKFTYASDVMNDFPKIIDDLEVRIRDLRSFYTQNNNLNTDLSKNYDKFVKDLSYYLDNMHIDSYIVFETVDDSILYGIDNKTSDEMPDGIKAIRTTYELELTRELHDVFSHHSQVDYKSCLKKLCEIDVIGNVSFSLYNKIIIGSIRYSVSDLFDKPETHLRVKKIVDSFSKYNVE